MSVIIFIIVLSILIFSHELGHFLAARSVRIRVDEFAIGFPPRLFSWKRGETTYALNLIPFGGYVKIFGENPDEESLTGPDASRSISNKSKWAQAWVLVAGILFNLLLAWLLIVLAYSTVGLPTARESVPEGYILTNDQLLIAGVAPDSPAALAELKPGDVVESVALPGQPVVENPTSIEVQKLVAEANNQIVTVAISRAGDQLVKEITPTVVGAEPPRLGIQMAEVGTLGLPIHKAITFGTSVTLNLIKETGKALALFLASLFQGDGDALSQVTGPVGLVGIVGGAARIGLGYLMSLTALISINLALLNLIPFPALDGGRVLFLAIEAVKGSPIKPKVANTVNVVGFSLLILLMVFVTVSDIFRLF